MEIVPATSTETAAVHAAARLESYMRRLDHEHVPFLFLVSGGSSLQVLNLIPADIFSNRTTVGLLDERFTADPSINNFLMFEKTGFYAAVIEKGAHVLRSVPDNESLDAFAHRLDASLKEWRVANPEGEIIVLQGVGPDGHTSGIVPFPDVPDMFTSLFESNAWVIGYDADHRNQYPLRATTTNTFLRNAVDMSVVFVVGESKSQAVLEVLSSEGSLVKTPGRIVHEMKNVCFVTDQVPEHMIEEENGSC